MSDTKVIISPSSFADNQSSTVQLAAYLADLTMEKSDQSQGVVENLEANVRFLALIVGRMIERNIISRHNTNLHSLETLLFGEPTGQINRIQIEVSDEDDIPF